MSTTLPAPSPGDVDDVEFWRDLAERIVRQVVQVGTPVFAAMVAGGKAPNFAMLAWAMVAVVVYTAAKVAVGITADSTSALWARLADRVVSAVAATFIAFVPQEALSTWAGWSGVNWGAVGIASLGAAGTSLIMYYFAPPANS